MRKVPLRQRVAAASVVALVLLIAATAVLTGQETRVAEQPQPDASFNATLADGFGVSPMSAFTLESSSALDIATVRAALSAKPQVAFDVAGDGRRFTVTPAQPLRPDESYVFTFALRGHASAWTFHTQPPLRILGTMPTDGEANVPVTSAVEVMLSHQDVGDAQPYWTITPAVPGRFEVHETALVFVPGQLLPGTTYRVTLRSGLGVRGGGPALASDVTFAFTTAGRSGGGEAFVPSGPYEFSTTDPPLLSVSGPVDGHSFAVSVYRYADAQRYMTALGQPPTDGVAAGVPKVASFTAQPRSIDSGRYILFPEALAPGYYAATVTDPGSAPKVVRFQVTDISFYVSVTQTQTLVWLNDLAKGGPLRDAKLRVGASDVVTGPDGLAVFPTQTIGKVHGLQTLARAPDGREAVINVSVEERDATLPKIRPELYWRYLYLDRPVYRSGDTIGFWGVMLPREKTVEPVQRITLTFGSEGGEEASRTTFTVTEGLFSGTLKMPSAQAGPYLLRGLVGDTPVLSRTVKLEEEEPASYVLDLTADRRVAIAGDSVEFTARARYPEGTPIAGLPITFTRPDPYDPTRKLDEIVATTNAKGEASQVFRTGGPPRMTVRASTELPHAGITVAERSVELIESSVYATASTSLSANRGELKLQLRQVSLDRMNQGLSCCAPEMFLGPPAAGRTVTGTLTRQEWTKTENGESYDLLTRKIEKQYRYDEKTTTVASFTLTSNPAGEATYGFAVDPDRFYRISFVVNDGQGREYRGQQTLAGTGYANAYDTTGRLEAGAKTSWKIGEMVELTYQRGGQATASRANGFLFYTARLGLARYQVQSDPVYRFSFRDQDIPNTNVRGVYFDGRAYFPAYSYLDYSGGALPGRIGYDPRERALMVKVSPDKAEYHAGESAVLAIEVTDGSGRPAQAIVSVNVVDDAVYALAAESVNLVGGLYTDTVPADELGTYSSNLAVSSFGAGCGVGGGGRDAVRPRQIFQDATTLKTVTTDSSGKATLSISLPGSSTTWRLTYHAIDAKLEAASGTLQLATKRTFAAQVFAADSYRSGDAPAIVARAQGEKLKDGDAVTLDAQITGPVPFSVRTSARAFEAKALAAPVLVPGVYTVTLSAEGPGGLKDVVRRTFRVEAPVAIEERGRREGFAVTREYVWEGDLLKITLRPSLPASAPGGYEVIDVLPAGLRPLIVASFGAAGRSDTKNVPVRVEGQRVVFSASPGMEPITYYARKLNAGIFTADPVTIRPSGSASVLALSAPKDIRVP